MGMSVWGHYLRNGGEHLLVIVCRHYLRYGGECLFVCQYCASEASITVESSKRMGKGGWGH